MSAPAARPSFEEYAATGWPVLVRTLVLLGLDRGAAEVAARRALSRAMLAWGEIGHIVGRDAYVHTGLLRAAGPLPVGALDAAEARVGLDPDLGLRSALLTLPVDERLALVLRRFARVGEADARQVLNTEPSGIAARVERAATSLAGVASAAPLLAGAERADDIAVGILDLDDIRDDADGRQRRVRFGVVAVFLVIAVLVLLILAAGG